MRHLYHIATKQYALVKKHVDGLVLAQFDDLSNKHAYGWHLYRHKEFKHISKIKK